MKPAVKRALLALACVLLAALLVVGGYVAYLSIQYHRIEDAKQLLGQPTGGEPLVTGQAYSALTYNIGFGAYEPGFSFFMDKGRMLDGTAVQGSGARAASAKVVTANTQGVAAVAAAEDCDFMLFQEVDQKAHRSRFVNQDDMLREQFSGYSAVYASNFHSAYLAYPLPETHGAVESGLLALARPAVSEATRRSLPVDESFPAKFFDLDRCFTLLRVPVEGSRQELVLINLHLSAFDEGGVVRAAQMEKLLGVLAEERGLGNWVVAGGDFNHALGGTIEAFPSGQQVPEWVVPFEAELLPEGFRVVEAGNPAAVPTCRSSDISWQPGVSYTTVLDGFIVSDNVAATASNIDTGFAFSDHNPVRLDFTLQ